MLKRRLSRIALQAAAAAAALALAACGAQPYPEPSEAPPPPPPPSELLGEPLPPPPPPPPTETYSETAPIDQSSAPVIIAMAPIPNPPEGEPRVREVEPQYRAPTDRYVQPSRPRAAARARSTRVAPAHAAPARPAHAASARPAYQTGAVAPRAVAPKALAPKAVAPRAVARAAPKPAPAKVVPPASVAKVAPLPKVTRPAAPTLGAVPALKTPAAPDANATSPIGDRATRLAALEMALANAVSKNAKLAVPGSFTANTPADVILTLPADFAQTFKDEAAKNELSDAAAAVNVTSLLSGDGFSVTPDATQSQPLVAGQPTEFHWTVTAMPGAKGLHADVGADLIGAGSDVLKLGTVKPSGGGLKLTPRVLGAGILVLIAALVVAGLTRGRSNAPRSAADRRDARRARRDPRPVTE